MINMLTRHAIQVLRKAGHTQAEVATLTGVSEREVRRVEREPAVETLDLPAERERRGIGRPSKAEPFRQRIVDLLARERNLLTADILRRVRLEG